VLRQLIKLRIFIFVVSKITEHAIREVTAYLNISERKEMLETRKGQWGSVSWPYTFSTLWNYTAKRYEVNCPTFELLIRLREPSIDGQKIILKQLGQLFESQTFSDVEFNVKGQKMTAHAAILAAGSPVMAAMFQREGFQEGRPSPNCGSISSRGCSFSNRVYGF
jgi:BTB/POZ domain